ncbi:MAG: hypothetical protein ACK55I_05045, partial [bacterium]
PGKAKPAGGVNPLVSAGLGALAGTTTGSPTAGVLGAVLPFLTAGGARMYAGSAMGQRAITPGVKNVLANLGGEKITDPLILNALLASVAANRSEQ